LCELLTQAHLRSEKGKCAVRWDELPEFAEGLLRFWVAHPSRMLASASRDRELFLSAINTSNLDSEKDCFGATPKPARETRALPRVWKIAHDF